MLLKDEEDWNQQTSFSFPGSAHPTHSTQLQQTFEYIKFYPKESKMSSSGKKLDFLQNNSFKDLLNFHQEKTFPAKEVELRFCQKIYMNVPFS